MSAAHVNIDELSDLAKRAAADSIRAIRMHPETIAALKMYVAERPAPWLPASFLGTPVFADTSVPVGDWEVDR